MSKSITELFSRNSDRVSLPDNIAQPRDTKDGTGSWVTTGQIEGSTKSYKEYLADATKSLPDNSNDGYESIEDYKTHLDSITPHLRVISDTLSKYEQFKNDPAAYMSLFGGLLNVNTGLSDNGSSTYNKLNKIADKVGLGLPNVIQDGVIPIPAYMSYEDGRLISTAVNAIQTTLKSSIGGRMRTNYELLFHTQTGGDIMNSLINIATDDFFKKEFEKSRLPWQLPNMDIDKYSWYIYKSSSEKSNKNGGLWSAIKGVVTDMVDDFMEKQDSNAANVLYGKAELSSDAKKKYDKFIDPYEGYGNLTTEASSSYSSQGSFNAILSGLESKGLLRGYKDYAGFELGSNHNWLIKLRPYYNFTNGRETLTPPLPEYVLPNLWLNSNKIDSTLFDPKTNDAGSNGNWNKLINSWTDRVIDNVYNRLTFGDIIDDMPSDSTLGGVLTSALKDAIWGKDEDNNSNSSNLIRRFSYSEHTPVLSYDLNFGTIRTESQRLFNGSSVEVFSGMQYNATMNMSILDDVYHSMYKYMIEYTNKIYDISNSSMAPYYSMAFEIELIILRSGNLIDQHYKFIGIPIEFTPRLDGSDQPNESRVDMTFGIIGLIPPDRLDMKVYTKYDLARSGSPKDSGTNQNDETKTNLTWGDIMINIGGNLTKK